MLTSKEVKVGVKIVKEIITSNKSNLIGMAELLCQSKMINDSIFHGSLQKKKKKKKKNSVGKFVLHVDFTSIKSFKYYQ